MMNGGKASLHLAIRSLEDDRLVAQQNLELYQ